MTYSLYQLGKPAALSAAESGELAARVAGLASAGMPLDTGLLALADELPGRQSILRNLATRLSRGEPFEKASLAADARLPDTLRGLIAAGLRSGRLPEVLDEYASLIRRQQMFRRQATLVLIYPALLSCAMAAMLVVFRYFLMRDMWAIFKDFGMKLPELTEFVFWATPYVMWGAIVLAIGVSVAALLPIFLARVWPFTILLEYLPVVGSIVRYRQLAAASELMAILLENDVPAPESLELAAAANEAPRLASALRNSADSVRQGCELYEALGIWGLPQRLSALVAWGQTAGDVPGAFRAAAESFEGRLQSKRQFLELLIGPVFFLLITGVGGLIALAFMMPLISLITCLSGGGK